MNKSSIIKLIVLFLVAVTAVVLALLGVFDGGNGESSSSIISSSSSSKNPTFTHIHSWQDATCLAPKTCSGCGAVEGEKLPHSFVNGTCEYCGEAIYLKENGYLYFGSYPQSRVTDDALLEGLSSLIGGLPSEQSASGWNDYGYYSLSHWQSYGWYKDVQSGGEKYRAIYFTANRPLSTDRLACEGQSFQDDNGYLINTIYWFKFEPLKWRILKETEDEMVLFSSVIIDSHEFYTHYQQNRVNEQSSIIYPNNYEYSTVRSWLNNEFYNLAFNEEEKSFILQATVKNGASTTGASTNPYACKDTLDKLFLLSYEEVNNSEYVFKNPITKRLVLTDYALSQGGASREINGAICGYWLLRSPYEGAASGMKAYDPYCELDAGSFVNSSGLGIAPALKIKLN